MLDLCRAITEQTHNGGECVDEAVEYRRYWDFHDKAFLSGSSRWFYIKHGTEDIVDRTTLQRSNPLISVMVKNVLAAPRIVEVPDSIKSSVFDSLVS